MINFLMIISFVSIFSYFVNIDWTFYVKVYVRDTPKTPAAPFKSMAEMMKKFESSTRDLPLPNTLSHVMINHIHCFTFLLHLGVFKYFLTNYL